MATRRHYWRSNLLEGQISSILPFNFQLVELFFSRNKITFSFRLNLIKQCRHFVKLHCAPNCTQLSLSIRPKMVHFQLRTHADIFHRAQLSNYIRMMFNHVSKMLRSLVTLLYSHNEALCNLYSSVGCKYVSSLSLDVHTSYSLRSL